MDNAVAYSIQDFSADLFAPHLDRSITFLQPASADGSREPVELQLVEISRSGQAPGAVRPFSLLFSTDQDAKVPLESGLLALMLEGFESCELYLCRVSVPERSGETGKMYFEAVFN